ncbi:NAD(P)-binding domain-containing protein [Luteolibacter algae]|uniref:NAD(P)-binding domain-containing protein n=1 Tax=Luteolibacter algae TaxID=454151 RepID=A0ABW5D9W3_9BACT
MQKRLAIIGAGCSGLITLKNAVEQLPGWEIVCFEQSDKTIGCWGNPYPGFASTSTKFTTQFSCFRKWSSSTEPENRATKTDFFRDDEYEQYLLDFVRHFNLAPHIRTKTKVTSIKRVDGTWKLSIDDGSLREESFDKVILCTGLVAKPKHVDSEVPVLEKLEPLPRNRTLVVLGGGESAADLAHRLAAPALGNRVYLSLKNGIRVSPRYHPIRGVPSDFLRNRLLLSIHQNLRNAIGQKFVEARIKHQEKFEKFFNASPRDSSSSESCRQRRKYWDAKLTARAKDQLFNVFHTKSDDFLDDVAEQRIQIVGPPTDASHRVYADFEGVSSLELAPDLICPMIGYKSSLEDISEGRIHVEDFHMGCLHVEWSDLFLVGFARPIIGNIPTISEMQARYVVGTISGKYSRPEGIRALHELDRQRLERDFPNLNTLAIYPVEMFPYCDKLASLMGSYPSIGKTGSIVDWIKIQLTPASTIHYLDGDYSTTDIRNQIIHSPPLIVFLLFLIKIIDYPYRLIRGSGR